MEQMHIRRTKKSAVMRIYFLGHYCVNHHIPLVPALLSKLVRVLFSCELPMTCKLHPDCELIHNGLGAIHENTEIGKGTLIYQHVTIGGRNHRGYPIIGENVFIGCGACILGGIKIGDGARIGANCVVLTDIPPMSTVVGVPGRVVKINTEPAVDIWD